MIDLDKQLEYFDEGAQSYLLSIAMALTLDDFAQEVISVARERLIEGYEEYGDLMFTWDNKTARRNVIEELADAVNYMVSREVQFDKDLESVGASGE